MDTTRISLHKLKAERASPPRPGADQQGRAAVVGKVPATFVASLALATLATGASGKTSLRASHQWPGGQGDGRDEMVQIIAEEVAKAGVDLGGQIYPGARLNDSPFMADIKAIIEENGVMVIADAWLAGGFASTQNCITGPDTMQGQATRAAGPMFEQMLAGAGASIASMPSSEIYTGMQTGVLDAANTSSGSFVSYRLYEQVKCLTAPGENALWFMYEPILMSKQSFDRLTPEQQQALLNAGQAAEDYFFEAAQGLDKELVETFKKNGVEVAEMSKDQF